MQKRISIPDEQIRDAADQFEEARKLLASRPPGSGVVLPTVNCAATAIELYLKSLGAETIYGGNPLREVVPVYAKAEVRGHDYVRLYQSLPRDVSQELAAAFANYSFEHISDSIEHVLGHCAGLLEASRYPFEQGQDFQSIPFAALMELSDFLAQWVSQLFRKGSPS